MTSISIMKNLIFEECINNSVVEFEIIYFKADNCDNLIYENKINEIAIH